MNIYKPPNNKHILVINNHTSHNSQPTTNPNSKVTHSTIYQHITPNINTAIKSSTRTKPLSMNDSMLSYMLHDQSKKQQQQHPPLKTKPNSKITLSIGKVNKSSTKEQINNINNTTNSSIINDQTPTELSVNQNSMMTTSSKSIKSSLAQDNHNHNRSKNIRNISKAKPKVAFTNKKCVITLNNEIPMPTNKHLQKIPSNGSNLDVAINQSHTSTDRDAILSTSSNLKTYNSIDSYKLTEEILEFKLNNSKLRNEISILNEKIKTLKQVIVMKTDENELIKVNYTEIIEEYKKESEKARKLLSEFNSMKETIKQQNFHLISTISIMTDLIEIFVSPRSTYALGNSHIMTRQSITTNNENISATDIDVYYSYTNDDDRRNTLVEQIQALLVAKLNVIKKSVGTNIDVEKEIERIKSWSLFIRNPNESEINISNLRLSKNIIEESYSESFRKNCSNDFFDLSISNQIMSQSPKFNSAANSVYSASAGGYNKDKERGCLNLNNNEKNGDNFLLNDSFLKDLKQSTFIFKFLSR